MTRHQVGGSRFIVVGAGIVGLATARALQLDRPGAEVTVLEKESSTARHQTGHNSGVLHSGIYYRPGSLKARMCTEGRSAMTRFAESRDIPYKVTGKLIVATSPKELPRLDALMQRGLEHGLTLRRLDAVEVREREPHVDAIAAIQVDETGIIDFVAVADALRADIEQAGGHLAFDTTVREIVQRPGSVKLCTDTASLEADALINCAGLQADLVMRMAGDRPSAQIIPFRGEYFELKPERTSLVRGLVYPVPDPDLPFLGVHLTRMIDGSVHCGPNAVLALAREGYRWRNVDPGELRRLIGYRGTWSLARSHVRTGAAEVLRSLSRRRFVRSLQRLVPDITDDDLIRSPAGVRAQAVAPDGALLDDFEIVRSGRIVNVINAPSPAATSSLVIGRHVASLVSAQL